MPSMQNPDLRDESRAILGRIAAWCVLRGEAQLRAGGKGDAVLCSGSTPTLRCTCPCFIFSSSSGVGRRALRIVTGSFSTALGGSGFTTGTEGVVAGFSGAATAGFGTLAITGFGGSFAGDGVVIIAVGGAGATGLVSAFAEGTGLVTAATVFWGACCAGPSVLVAVEGSASTMLEAGR